MYGDDTDTLPERISLAREDVTRLGEEIQSDDLPVDDPVVAAHVQAALDAYDDSSHRVDGLATDDDLRDLGDVVAYARWRIACAKAQLAGEPAPATPGALLPQPRPRGLGRRRRLGTARRRRASGPGVPRLFRGGGRVMTGNLAPVLSRIASTTLVLCLGTGWFAAGAAAADPARSTAADPAVDTYLDDLAIELAHPGLFVDPAVQEGTLDEGEVERLDALTAKTSGPVRIAVVPMAAVGRTYDPNELVAQLYDRVGVDGTYAVLVDADSQADGRSFTAWQFLEEGPRYDIDGALDAAIECCAPEYAPMIERFLEEAGDREVRGWMVMAWVAGATAALGGGWYGLVQLFRRRRRPVTSSSVGATGAGNRWSQAPPVEIPGALILGPLIVVGFFGGMALWRTFGHNLLWGLAGLPVGAVVLGVGILLVQDRRSAGVARRVLETTRPLVTEDVIALSAKLGALPALPADAPAQQRATLAGALELVSEASERLDSITDTTVAEAVIARLADAQYELVKLEALQAGEQLPKRRAPCFIDPRHGPGPQIRSFTPEGGAARDIRVCVACAAMLDRNEMPEPRTIAVGGRRRPYWEADRYARPYVNGYWQKRPFPDPAVESSRRWAVERRGRTFGSPKESWSGTGTGTGQKRRAFTIVWEGGGGSGGSGGSGSSGPSSFGGGSSSRSSTGSGGSRGF